MQQEVAHTPRSFRWSDTAIVILVGFAGAILIGGLLIARIYDIEDDTIDPAAQFWVLLPSQVLAQIAAVIWVSRRRGTGNLAQDFGFEIEPQDMKWLLAGRSPLFGFGAVATVLRAILQLTDENPQALLDSVAEYRGSVTALAVVIGVAVLGPVSEELTFRGLLLRTALDKGFSPWIASVISAAVFSLSHLVDWSMATLAGSVTLVVLFLFGVLLAQVRNPHRQSGGLDLHPQRFHLTTIVALFFFPEFS